MARSKRLTRCFAEDVPWMQTEAGSKTTNPSRLVSSFKLNQKRSEGSHHWCCLNKIRRRDMLAGHKECRARTMAGFTHPEMLAAVSGFGYVMTQIQCN